MKKYRLFFKVFLLISILYMPLRVDAVDCPENIEVDVCTSGCEFDNIEDAVNYIEDIRCEYDTSATINVGPGTYTISGYDFYNYPSITIKGAGKEKTIIYYLGEYGFVTENCENVYLSDFTIKNRKNSNADGAIAIFYSYGKAVIKSIKVDSYSKFGISIQSIHEGATISNVDIKNTSDAAIYRNECNLYYNHAIDNPEKFNPESTYFNGKIEISNSDLTGNGCGVVEGSIYCSYKAPINASSNITSKKFEEIQQSGMGIIPNYYYTTRVTNTKLSCATATNDRQSDYTPLIYIPKNNTWVEEPEYFENVVEHNDGQVQVELEEDKTIGLNNKSGIRVRDVFKNIDSFGEKEVEIEDESIIKIEGDKIIPLKIGETTTTIKSGNATYIINLRVVENIANPKTSNTTYILILLLSLVAISTLTKILKRK